MRTLGVLQLIERVQTMLAEALEDNVLKVIDSKPLIVGNYSKDRNAKRGRAAGEVGRGYKLHAIPCGKAFMHWTLAPMNAYHSNAVHQIAQGAGHQLIAPARKKNAKVRDTRCNTPARLRSPDLYADSLSPCGLSESLGKGLLQQRAQIEQNFGKAMLGGLHAPSGWIQTPRRVTTWVAAKLI